jgi:Helix-hairpin-helix domain
MARHDRPESDHAGEPGDEFQKIAGIGSALARRLHDAGILTYNDLAERTPEEIAAILTDMGRVSVERIASQDWIGQARRLAGAQPEPSDPGQRYASFHIEVLLDADSVRRTKVHDHQTDTDDTWAGWDEDRLLTLLRDRLPTAAARQPTDAPDLQPPAPTDEPPPATVPTASLPQPASLPPSALLIEELTPIRDGRRGYLRRPDEATAVRLTLRINSTAGPRAATFDFSADVAARSKLGDNQRRSLGTVDGAIRGNEPVSVELTGEPLPPGLYRLVATVTIYPAGHTREAQPLSSRSATGDLVHVADAPTETAPAEGPIPSTR